MKMFNFFIRKRYIFIFSIILFHSVFSQCHANCETAVLDVRGRIVHKKIEKLITKLDILLLKMSKDPKIIKKKAEDIVDEVFSVFSNKDDYDSFQKYFFLNVFPDLEKAFPPAEIQKFNNVSMYSKTAPIINDDKIRALYTLYLMSRYYIRQNTSIGNNPVDYVDPFLLNYSLSLERFSDGRTIYSSPIDYDHKEKKTVNILLAIKKDTNGVHGFNLISLDHYDEKLKKLLPQHELDFIGELSIGNLDDIIIKSLSEEGTGYVRYFYETNGEYVLYKLEKVEQLNKVNMVNGNKSDGFSGPSFKMFRQVCIYFDPKGPKDPLMPG